MKLEIHYDGSWAALYVDGNLRGEPGDSYRVEEEAFELLGVRQVQDDAFMRGQKHREGVARTLAEVDEYRQTRTDRAAEVKRKREQAAALLAEAEALEAGR